MSDSNVISMEELLKSSPKFFVPVPGTIVDGSVITVSNSRILVDLDGVTTGVISGKEAVDSLNTLDGLTSGDVVSAFILEPENDEGLVVLSLRKASQQKTWKKFVNFYETKQPIEVKITEANKGGLLVEVDGIKGFIPVSQLAPMNYPRVNGADSAKILLRLQKLIGKKLNVQIINIDEENRKLVLSEKEAQNGVRLTSLNKIQLGDVLEGAISGVVNFGIFVTFEGLEGLVHISEIAWGHVDSPANFGKLGEKIKVKVIGIDGEKISLSMKQLSEDPWIEIAKKFKVGSKIKGVINRVAEYGAFLTIAEDINGLIHISEINHPAIKEKGLTFNENDEVEATIVNVDIENHRIGLSILDKSVASGSLTTLGLSDKLLLALEKVGIKSADELKGKSIEDLVTNLGLDFKTAEKVFHKLNE